ncbi:MAG: DoxX family protein, partial [Deltaproteobacteria bacterium]
TMTAKIWHDLGLLLLRVGFASCLIFGHGVQKWGILLNNPSSFPDPLGIGPYYSVIASMGAECGAAALVGLGYYTRLMALPVVFTMTIVSLVVHQADPWMKREPSVLFGVAFVAILCLGPGRLSLDRLVRH